MPPHGAIVGSAALRTWRPWSNSSRRGGRARCCLKNRGLKKEQFIEEADFRPSGVVRIAKLQKQGFAYLKP